jgi:hypothetical protein
MTTEGSSNNHYIPFLAILAVTAALGTGTLGKSETPRHLIYLLAILVFLSGSVTIISMQAHGDHDIPFLVPFVLVAGLVFLGILRVLKMDDLKRRVFIFTVLVIGQFAVALYYPPNYLPENGYKQGMAKLQSEIARLKGSVLWIDYGNVPAPHRPKIRLSWVAVHDVERQRIAEGEAAKELIGYRSRINSDKEIYILSNRRLEESGILVWKSVIGNFEVMTDYGEEFAPIRQITYHWFSGGDYPRFLYRKRTSA